MSGVYFIGKTPRPKDRCTSILADPTKQILSCSLESCDEDEEQLFKILEETLIYVDVRAENENRSKAISRELQKLGAQITDKIGSSTTHVVFKDGRKSTVNQLKKFPNIHVVSVLWVDSCKSAKCRVREELYRPSLNGTYDSPLPLARAKRVKSLQPKTFEEDVNNSAKKEERRKRRLKKIQNSNPFFPFTVEEKLLFSESDDEDKNELDDQATDNEKIGESDENINPNIHLSIPHDEKNLSFITALDDLSEELADAKMNDSISEQQCNYIESIINGVNTEAVITDKIFKHAESPSSANINNVESRLKELNCVKNVVTDKNIFGSSNNNNSKSGANTNSASIQESISMCDDINGSNTRRVNSGECSKNIDIQTKQVNTVDDTSTSRTDLDVSNLLNEYKERRSSRESHSKNNVQLDSTYMPKIPKKKKKLFRVAQNSKLGSPALVPDSASLYGNNAGGGKVPLFDPSDKNVSILDFSRNYTFQNTTASHHLKPNHNTSITVRRSKLNNSLDPNKKYQSKKKLNRTVDSVLEENVSKDRTENEMKTLKPDQDIITDVSEIRKGNLSTISDNCYAIDSVAVKTASNPDITNVRNLNVITNTNNKEHNINKDTSNSREKDRRRSPRISQLKSSNRLSLVDFKMNKNYKSRKDHNISATSGKNIRLTSSKHRKQNMSISEKKPGVSAKNKSRELSFRDNNQNTSKPKKNCNSSNIISENSINKRSNNIESENSITLDSHIGDNNLHTLDIDSGISDSEERIDSQEDVCDQNATHSLDKSLLSANYSRIEKTHQSLVMTSLHFSEQDFVKAAVRKLQGFHLRSKVLHDTSHVVAGSTKRTLNILFAIVNGCWVLNTKWASDSYEEGVWLKEADYEMCEEFPIAKQSRLFRMNNEMTMHAKLFAHAPVMYLSEVTKPPTDQLALLVTACGGKVTSTLRKAAIIIGDISCRRKDLPLLSEKWILDSIMNCRIMPTNDYEISQTRPASPKF